MSAGRWFRKRLAVIGGGVATVLALSVLLVGQQSPAAAVGPDLLGVTVSNDSGRGEPVYLYVLGTDILPGSGRGYVNAAGTFTRWPAGGNPPVPAPDVSIAGPANGGAVTVRIPRFISGRMYFSFGQKLDFRLTLTGSSSPRPGRVTTPTGTSCSTGRSSPTTTGVCG